MRVGLIEHAPAPEWRAGLDALAAALAAQAGWTVVRGDRPAADAWLIAAGNSNDYPALLSKLEPRQLRCTVLLGVGLGWKLGAFRHEPGTLPHLLETHRLGGAFTPVALTAWRELPSYFAGPSDLLEEFGTNCIQAMQSDNYCFWGRARGGSLAEFLVAYLPALVRSTPS
jgi:hypothetical protein